MRSEKINILLVDDHSMVIEGMKSILAQIPLLEVTATAGNAFEAVAALRENNIDIAFVDINLPDISGIELCTKIKKEFTHVHVLGLSTFKQRSYVSQMIANGASGYLIKSAAKEEIEQAITDVMAGKMYFSIDVNNTKPEIFADEEVPTLTRREKEILILIAEGLTTNDIAHKIFVSPYTVETHRKNLLSKFKVGNTALLIKTAASFGLL
jgi:two-component system, NarL family, nitrate/nitrite response regulator NarL